MLGAVAGVVVDMALGLHDDTPLRCRQLAQRDVVRQRAGGHEDGALGAEPAGKGALHVRDDTAVGIAVGVQGLGNGELVQEVGVFQGAEMGAVVDEIDGLLQARQLVGVGCRAGQDRRCRSPRRQRAAEFERLSPPHGGHRSLVARIMGNSGCRTVGQATAAVALVDVFERHAARHVAGAIVAQHAHLGIPCRPACG